MINIPAISLYLATVMAACQPAIDTGMVEIRAFGDNPGNLDGYYYAPEGLPEGAPLVVVLHGCVQDAAEIARLSGWNRLADAYGFAVLYPQQKRINNLNNCFNWFVPEDISKGSGEARSIREMMSYVTGKLALNSAGAYITGISAGGAMAAVMLAAYPEDFRAGAVMSGIPYAAAADMATGFQAMKGAITLPAGEWEARVRRQNEGFTGSYPTLAIFHGVDDPVVNIINANELAKQWAALYDIDPEAPAEVELVDGNEQVKKMVYRDSAGATVLLRYDFDGLGHAIAVDPGEGALQGGAEGQFARDVDFYSSYWAARFFGLTGE